MLKQTENSEWTLGTHIAFRDMGHYWSGKQHKTKLYAVTELHCATKQLGCVYWFARWRKYVFQPDSMTVYEETCMREISEFIETKTKEYKAK